MTTAKKGNMFAVFEDDDEEVPQQKVAPVKKPVQAKPQEGKP